MKSIESLLKKYHPPEPSPNLLTTGVTLIRRYRRKMENAEVERHWRLTPAILATLLVGSAALNMVLWFENKELASHFDEGVADMTYIKSSVFRQENGRFVGEVRYADVQETE